MRVKNLKIGITHHEYTVNKILTHVSQENKYPQSRFT